MSEPGRDSVTPEITTRRAGPPLRVVYIAGAGRSGSTLFARILGQAAGFCYVGEMKYFWENGSVKNELCTCGSAFLD